MIGAGGQCGPNLVIDRAEKMELFAQASLRDRAQVFAPLAQRRYMDNESVQTVEQVGAHALVGLQLVNRKVRGGYHPDAGMHRAGSADADKIAGLEKPQQYALRGGRQ